MCLEYRLKVKHIHVFASEYLRDWFPNYGNVDYWAKMEKTNNSRIVTPIKDIKNQPEQS